jgi:hypothetical protein
MAEELLNMGATAVIGWGQNVRDTDATAAASQLYWELSLAGTLAKAIVSPIHFYPLKSLSERPFFGSIDQTTLNV